MSKFMAIGVAVALGLVLGGCAGASLGSGVGDRILSHPPYYAGGGVAAGPVAHLAVRYRLPEGDPESFGPATGSDRPVVQLLSEMNAYLDRLGATTRLESVVAAPGSEPDVHFSCEPDPVGDCAGPEQEPIGEDAPRMRLAVARPSSEWTAWLAGELSTAGAQSILLLTLETGDYWVRQKNWRGQKELELGTGHAVDVPWLTSLDRPVSVLQITGALIGPDGKARRIGAEGLTARRTPFLLSAVGVQALITDEDVETLRTARREDLPGRPLVWQVALRTLVTELTGSTDLRTD